MIIFISLLMAVIAVGFVIYPLLKQRMGVEVALENEALVELSSKRDTAYAMLKEVEFDYQSGILIEEDYRILQDRYKQKAVSVLKEIDTLTEEENKAEEEISEIRKGGKKPAGIGVDDIEAEILRLRKNKSRVAVVNNEDALENEIQRYRKPSPVTVGSGNFCTRCGTRSGAGDLFCANCGAELKHKEQAN